MKKVLIVFGTRPEAIKMFPVVMALQNLPNIQAKLAVTAQHRDMLDQVLAAFEIRPDYDLDVMEECQGLTDLTCKILTSMSKVLVEETPDLVLVHGDTTTTMAAALAAFYQQIPVGHVEAGLRSGDIYAPWPEEVNRKVVSAVATLQFAPTEIARANLLAENTAESQIHVTGNTVIDALFLARDRLSTDPSLRGAFDSDLNLADSSPLVLVTAHRRENIGVGIEAICDALDRLTLEHDVQIVFPVHPNPAVRDCVNNRLQRNEKINLISPQGYLPFVYLMMRASVIITDSGGIQEEASSLGTPVLVTREKTERPEGLDAGLTKLVGTDAGLIVDEVSAILSRPRVGVSSNAPSAIFGDGRAATRIAKIISQFLAKGF